MKYDNLLPCQNLMAANEETKVYGERTVHYYTCKSGDVGFSIDGDSAQCICDAIEKTCRLHCPALKK